MIERSSAKQKQYAQTIKWSHTHMRCLVFFALILLAGGCSQKQEGASRQSSQYVKGYNQPVRGVWLTNVDSKALYSRENIRQAVEHCHELGINTIFAVTWNKGMTTYRSQVMKEFTGVEINPELDPDHTGRDPLKELIEEAKRFDIKVFAWFEFGFSSSYDDQGGEILEKKPEWALKNADGELCVKNGFDWMNALDPEVQEFMMSLILEVVRNYDVDGIQGDDRLPAMPSEGGYNKATIEAYRADHQGQDPPEYTKDFEWVRWRASRLNDFMKRLYNQVKQADSSCIVSMAPSVYPWSKQEYLQDWPTWVNFNYVDMICPQLYRKDSSSYQQTLQDNLSYILPEKRHLVYPGVLIRAGQYNASPDYFEYMLKQNRKAGLEGEVYFFYEALEHYETLLKEYYLN